MSSTGAAEHTLTASGPPTGSGATGRSVRVIHADGHLSLRDWLDQHRDEYEAALLASGAVLFRGFGVTGAAAFELVARPLCGDLLLENPEHVPVSRRGTVLTPVPYAADRLLLWHNENSFNDEWPLRIAFACIRPAESGGETSIVDSCALHHAIDPAVRRRFIEKAVAYIRDFGSGLGLDWQTVFRTTNRAGVDQYCREHNIHATWTAGGGLRTVAVRPAVIPHPVTGELSWFNQAQHWHQACLDPEVREALIAGGAGMPRDCTFGDGTPIGDDEMRHIVDVYRSREVLFPWHRGDVLVIDNVMWAHGRRPYTGSRTILVGMGSVRRYPGGNRS